MRAHEPPEEEDLEELEGWMKSLNMKANMRSSKQIAQTLKNLFEKTMKFEGMENQKYLLALKNTFRWN